MNDVLLTSTSNATTAEAVYIITGASRGLGEALVRRLLRQGHRLICISRSVSDAVLDEAYAAGVRVDWIEYDLAQPPQGQHHRLSVLLAELLSQTGDAPVSRRLRLINNAGVLEPIGPANEASAAAAAHNIAVNLTAPMILTSLFLQLTERFGGDKRVLQISSGAGRKPYYGWSSYCAAKAGLDHFTRCVKLEQDALPNGAKVASVAPGVIDTAMQAAIRASDERSFRDRQRFVALHESGSLFTPADAAERLVRLLEHPSFGEEPVIDIRDLT